MEIIPNIDEKFKYITQDLQDLLNEDESLFKCKECGNDETFIVAISPLEIRIKKGTNEITNVFDTNARTDDSVYFICMKCNKIVLDSIL